jgi:hypothetical protein
MNGAVDRAVGLKRWPAKKKLKIVDYQIADAAVERRSSTGRRELFIGVVSLFFRPENRLMMARVLCSFGILGPTLESVDASGASCACDLVLRTINQSNNA